MKLRFSTVLIGIICLFLVNAVMAQDNKLRIHGISIGPGIASSSSPTAKSGVSLNFDIATIVDKHLISFSFNSGIDLNKGGLEENFTEFNLTYGRKWSVAQNLVFEGHAGIGIFLYNIKEPSILGIDFADSTIGFPIRAKVLYYLTEKFGFGLNPNLNLNSLENAYSLNLLFQYNLD